MKTPPPSYIEDLDMDEAILRPTMRRTKVKNAEESFQRQVRHMVRKKSQGKEGGKHKNRNLRTVGSRRGVVQVPGQLSQRVVVQARVVKHQGNGRESLQKYVHYIQRDGTGIDEKAGKAYSAASIPLLSPETVQEYVQGFVEKCAEDRHSFRFIVSPENAHELDLTVYTQCLMKEMEKDLGTKLEWIAVNHHNTDNPHTHILVRGRDDQGKDLVIDPQYISQGMRYQAMHLATLELGQRTALDIQRAVVSEVTKERFTQLDKALLKLCDGNHTADMRYDVPSPGAAFRKKQMQGRVQQLERMGLAKRLDQSGFLWELSGSLEQELKALGARGDIIKTMHRAMQGEQQHYRIFNGDGKGQTCIQGRVADKGLVNELYDREYAVIEAVDGYTYYVTLDNTKGGGQVMKGDTVEITAEGQSTSNTPTPVNDIASTKTNNPTDKKKVSMHVLSQKPLEKDIVSQAITWLDVRIVSEGGTGSGTGLQGYGREVREAMEKRKQVLLDRGIATRSGNNITLTREALKRLKDRMLDR